MVQAYYLIFFIWVTLLIECLSLLGARTALRKSSTSAISYAYKSGTFTYTYLNSAAGQVDIEKINEVQWDLFCRHHVGHWKGVQTGYDPMNDEVADHMYTEQRFALSKDEKEIKHTNYFVQGEIRTDCEVCFDSERLISKEMGSYTKGKLRSRLCENVELRGPGYNQRGVSVELVLRAYEDDARIRVLFSYRAANFADVVDTESGQELGIATSLVLADVVVNRERLGTRPLERIYNDGTKDFDMLFRRVDEVESPSLFTTKRTFSGTRRSINAAGDTIPLQINRQEGILPCTVRRTGAFSALGAYSVDEEFYRRELPGGLMIECPLEVTLEYDETTPDPFPNPFKIRCQWGATDLNPSGTYAGSESVGATVFGAEIAFAVQPESIVQDIETGRLLVDPRQPPPILLAFAVDEIAID